ncbi:MAG: ribosomal protein [Actinomycetia bacterium]|nr:ribosomal protein [Actinomycetes bacterium]
MANIKSQKKRILTNEKARLRNKAVRSELKTRIKRVQDSFGAESPDTPELLRLAQKRIDKAGEKGRIHKNQASRRVSRLMKAANKAAAATD